MMRSKARQKAIRILLSSILTSDLSVTEIKELAKEFEIGSLTRELAYIIRQLSEELSLHEDPQQQSETLDNLAEQAYRTIYRKGITKRVFLEILITLGGDAAKSYIDPQMTYRELVFSFYNNASKREIETVNSWIEGIGPRDPYLKGILKRQGNP